VDTQRIVLAFNGTATSCRAVTWLTGAYHAEVAALIVDVGQTDDLEDVHARALKCGAVRAHVVDRCDGFAREMIVPAAAAGVPLDDEALRRLAHPVIAAALVEVAAIESADAVAYASGHGSLGEQIRAVNPTIRVLSPTREWVHQHLSPAVAHGQRHLLLRSPVATATSAAQLTIGFASGIPVSVNGVTMGLRELIESVSLIGGQYAAGLLEVSPALGLLQAAYRASGGRGAVTLQLQPGSLVIVDDRAARPALVSQA
jgi:argininosuccinate synthase